MTLVVEDDGPGFGEGVLRSVGSVPTTTKPSGMGMGLSIARTIIEAHDGQISAENHASKGALFRISLPLARSAASAAAAS